jgi:Tol biopolymer transport system component
LGRLQLYPKSPISLNHFGEGIDPWDLYFMNPDGDNVRMIASGMTGTIKWLPKGGLMSISGIVKGKDGIWLFNPQTSQVTLLWPYPTSYDWSPDGKQMVVIEHLQQNGKEVTRPIIVEVPADVK